MLNSAKGISSLFPRCNSALGGQRWFCASSTSRLTQVDQLPDWDLNHFRDKAFKVNQPMTLPFTPSELPPACKKWFIHDGNSSHDLQTRPKTSELRTSFWSDHESTIVPLELTSTTPSSSSSLSSNSENEETTFHRTHAPLKILLTYLGNPKSPSSSTQNPTINKTHSIYLAQCDLPSLPKSLQHDLPTPSLVLSSGKGDIYSSSLWLGRPPTYTPLHRDPNPNLFLQLAGQKTIRLFPPDVGHAIFEQVQDQLQGRQRLSASVRGEEMMQGPEKELLHRVVWGDSSTTTPDHDTDKEGRTETTSFSLLDYALEARLGLGQGLFIPKGWWHSVKGVGEGVTASANWWFR